eukprot:5422783-Prymnesium_polylepis.1
MAETSHTVRASARPTEHCRGPGPAAWPEKQPFSISWRRLAPLADRDPFHVPFQYVDVPEAQAG